MVGTDGEVAGAGADDDVTTIAKITEKNSDTLRPVPASEGNDDDAGAVQQDPSPRVAAGVNGDATNSLGVPVAVGVAPPTPRDPSSCIQCDPASGSWRDSLGFPLQSSPETLSWSEKYDASLKLQRRRWKDFLEHQKMDLKKSPPLTSLPRTVRRQIKSLALLGCPSELRSQIWPLCVSPRVRQRAGGSTYLELVARYEKRDRSTGMEAQLDKDMHRTFPDHPMFIFEEGRTMLWRVLHTFAHFNPTVGYCQGMNFIAGMLLLATHCEEHAFWLLATFVEDLLPGYYLPSLIGVHVDTHAFEDLVAMKLPKLTAHFQTLEIGTETLRSTWMNWLMCLWINALPTEGVLRVWDLMLLAPMGAKPLLRIGLALLTMESEALLSMDDADMAMMHISKMARNCVDCDALITAAYQDVGALPKALLNRLRTHHARRILSDDRIFDVFVATSAPLRHLRADTAENTRKVMCGARRGARVWSGDDGGVVCVWDGEAGFLVHKCSTKDSRRVCAMADATSEMWIGCAGGNICRYDADSFVMKGTLSRHTTDVQAMTAHGRRVWTAAGNIIMVWQMSADHGVVTGLSDDDDDVTDPVRVRDVAMSDHEMILCMASSSEGDRLFVGTHSALVIFQSDGWDYPQLRVIRMEHSGGCTDIVEVPRPDDAVVAEGAGAEVWCIHGNSEIGIWDTGESGSGQSMHKGYGRVCKLLALPNGEVWSAANDGSVIVWSTRTKRPIRELALHDAPISAMICMPNGALDVLAVWAASFEGGICIWVAEELHALTPQARARISDTRDEGNGGGGAAASVLIDGGALTSHRTCSVM